MSNFKWLLIKNLFKAKVFHRRVNVVLATNARQFFLAVEKDFWRKLLQKFRFLQHLDATRDAEDVKIFPQYKNALM